MAKMTGRRFWALLVAILMIVQLLPAAALAEDDTEDTRATTIDEYYIDYYPNTPEDATESYSMVRSDKIQRDASYQLDSNVFSFAGYELVGWSRYANATTAEYAPNEIGTNWIDLAPVYTEQHYMLSIDLYAVWQKTTPELDPINLTATGYVGEYDRTPHGITVNTGELPEGTTVYYSTDNDSWSEDAPTWTEITKDEEGNIVALPVYVKAENPLYQTATAQASVKITKRVITVTGEAVVPYNGEEQSLVLTAENASGLLEGDNLTMVTSINGDTVDGAVILGTATGEYTEYVEEGFYWDVIRSFSGGSGAIPDLPSVKECYDLDINGKLTIKGPTDITVRLVGNSDTVEYDGQMHEVSGYTVELICDDEELANQFDKSALLFLRNNGRPYAENGIWYAEGRNATSADGIEMNVPSVCRYTGSNAGLFNITWVKIPGKLTITKRPVTVYVEDMTADYTGGQITGHRTIRYSNLVSGHTTRGLGYNPAQGTEIGTYEGEFHGNLQIRNGNQSVTRNYEITYRPGKLTIRGELLPAEELGLTATGYVGEYDRTPHGITVNTGELPEGTTVYYSTDNDSWSEDAPTWTEITKDEEGNIVALPVYVKAENPLYQTATAQASVKITKRVIWVTGEATVFYSGDEQRLVLTAAENASGLLEGDNLMMVTSINGETVDGAVILGTATGEYTEYVKEGFYWDVIRSISGGSGAIPDLPSVKECYDIDINGKLTIKGPAEMLGLTATGYVGEYDRTPHGITVNTGELPEGTTVYYSTDNDSWSEDAPTWTEITKDEEGNIVALPVYVKAENPLYQTATAQASVKITKRVIRVTGEATVFYSGDEQRLVLTADNATGLLEGDNLTMVTPINGDTVDGAVILGTATGEYTEYVEEGFYWDVIHSISGGSGAIPDLPSVKECYDLVINGKLTIKGTAEMLGLTAEGYTADYDGQEHGITVNESELPEGTTVYYSTDGENWSETAPLYSWVSETGAEGVTVYVKAENPLYETATTQAVVKINPRPLTLTGTAEYIYNGEERMLMISEADVQNLVEGDVFGIATTIGEETYEGYAIIKGTEVGTYTIPEEYTWGVTNKVQPGFSGLIIKTSNYTLTVSGTLTIKGTAEMLGLTAEGYEDVYDGQAHGITVNESELPEGTTVYYSTDGENWSETAPLYSFVADTGAEGVTVYVKAENPLYETATTQAVIKINPRPLTLTGTAVYIYNGEEQMLMISAADVQNLVEGDAFGIATKIGEETYEGYAIIKGTDVGTYTTVEEYQWSVTNTPPSPGMSGLGLKTDNYTLDVSGTLTINKAQLTITTGSDEKIYDGKPLTNGEAKIIGLVNNETATITAIGSQTLVGSTDNTYEIEWGTAKQSNYEIAEDLGTLTVNNRPSSDRFRIEIATNSGGEIYYDGQEHSAEGFKGVYYNDELNSPTEDGKLVFIIDGVEFYVDGVTASGISGVDAGSYNRNMVVGTPIVRDADGNDVTAQFYVGRREAHLVILKAWLTISTGSAEKVYDGTALTSEEVTVEGLADGETINIRTTGSQTLIGESENAYEIVDWGNAKESNYMLDEAILGTLTVTDGTATDPDDPNPPTPVDDGLVVTKEVAEEKEYNIGDEVTFNITATNIYGEAMMITLTEIEGVTLAQSMFEDVEPGATVETTATYTITEDDIRNGEFVNTVTAAVGNLEKEATATVTLTEGQGKLEVSKIVTSEAPEGGYNIGDEITYEITVTNSGNLTVTNVVVTDELTGDVWDDNAPLAPGESLTFEATYTVTEDDIRAQSITNTATATGDGAVEDDTDPEDGDDDVTTGDDEIADGQGKLEVSKIVTSEAPEGGYNIGDEITYEITVTNSGNLTVTNVVVTDELTGDEWTVEALEPGASETFEATYVVTEDDIRAQSITNTATATGDGAVEDDTDPEDGDDDVTTGDDEIADGQGKLEVEKVVTSEAPEGGYNIGDEITYEITVTNSGNLTVTNVVVTDELTGDEWTVEALEPGASETFEATYVVTEDDIRAQSITNTATATGDGAVEDDTDPEDGEGEATIGDNEIADAPGGGGVIGDDNPPLAGLAGTVVFVPGMQVESTGKRADNFTALVDYLANANWSDDTMGLMSTGNTVTRADDAAAWQFAKAQLDRQSLPYGSVAGINDVTNGDTVDYSAYATSGFIPANAVKNDDGSMWYQIEKDMMFVAIGYQKIAETEEERAAQDAWLKFINDALAANEELGAVLLVNDFIDANGELTAFGKLIEEEILAKNDNIALVLCASEVGEAQWEKVYNEGEENQHTVHAILFNHSDDEDKAFIRLLAFEYNATTGLTRLTINTVDTLNPDQDYELVVIENLFGYLETEAEEAEANS